MPDEVDENSTKFYQVHDDAVDVDIADIAIKEHFQNW
jgi:hypothetical protein